MSLQIEYRSIAEMHPLDNNPRIIKDKDFRDLVESIKQLPEFFEARPCILSNRTGKNIIIAGNQRYRAAIEAGKLEGIVDNVGLPDWKHSMVSLNFGNLDDNIVLIPLSRITDNKVSGIIAIHRVKEGGYIIDAIKRSDIKLRNSSVPIRKHAFARAFKAFDKQLFNTTDNALEADIAALCLESDGYVKTVRDCEWKTIQVCSEHSTQTIWLGGLNNMPPWLDHDRDGIPNDADQDWYDFMNRYNVTQEKLEQAWSDFWLDQYGETGFGWGSVWEIEWGNSDIDLDDWFIDFWNNFWDEWVDDPWGDDGYPGDDRDFIDPPCPDMPINGGINSRNFEIHCNWYYVLDCGGVGGSNWWDTFDEVQACTECVDWDLLTYDEKVNLINHMFEEYTYYNGLDGYMFPSWSGTNLVQILADCLVPAPKEIMWKCFTSQVLLEIEGYIIQTSLSPSQKDFIISNPRLLIIFLKYNLPSSVYLNAIDKLKTYGDLYLNSILSSTQLENIVKLLGSYPSIDFSTSDINQLIQTNYVEGLNNFLAVNDENGIDLTKYVILKRRTESSAYRFDRFSELYTLIANANEDLLINAFSGSSNNPYSFWSDLANFIPPQNVLTKISSLGPDWKLQPITEPTYAPHINLDYFPVEIHELPFHDSPTFARYTPLELIEKFRLELPDYLDQGLGHFEFLNNNEQSLWNSSTPTGTVFSINIFPDDGPIICSQHEPCCWIFSTITAPIWPSTSDGTHPVSGNRQFGISPTPNSSGNYVIYTKGVDRVFIPKGPPGVQYETNNITKAISYLMERLAFNGADNLWASFQENVVTFINSKGGSATVKTPIKKRPKVDVLKTQLKSNQKLNYIPCSN